MTLDASQALATLDTLIALPDAEQSKANVIAIAQGSDPPLDVDGMVPGDPSERMFDYIPRAMAAWGSVPEAATRGYFLRLGTDPGDVDDLGNPDKSADQTPRAGFLSARGVEWFATERGGQTSATSFITIRNTGTTATLPFAAGQLFFEASGETRDDGGTPTYVNTADPDIYTGLGDTLTLDAGASVEIPVRAMKPGEYGSADVDAIDTANTQSYQTTGQLVVDASTRAVGREREPRAEYIARCLVADDSNAPGGPTNAYRRAMNTARDGSVLQRFDGAGPVAITDAYISADSSTGVVTIYYAGPTGAVDQEDVSSANANIIGLLIADPVTGAYHNPHPVGVLPDTVTLGPDTSDPNLPSGTPGGESCTNTSINVTWSARIRASRVPGGAATGTYTSGGSPPANIQALADTADDAIDAYLLSAGIGGLDQTAGAGVVYTADIQRTVGTAVAGFYAESVTTPVTSTTAITLGHIGRLGTPTWSIVVTAG